MNPQKCYGIYVIVNLITERVYVGRTNKTFSKRWGQHISMLNRGVHQNTALQADWVKYGRDAFEFRIVAAFNKWPAPGYMVDRLEAYYIETLPGQKYNMPNKLKRSA